MGGMLPKYGFKYLMNWLMGKNGDIMHVFLYRWYTSLTSLTLRYQVYSILLVWRWLLTPRSGTWGRLNFYTLYLHSTSVRSDSVTTPVSYMEVNLQNIIQECTWAYPRPQGSGSMYFGTMWVVSMIFYSVPEQRKSIVCKDAYKPQHVTKWASSWSLKKYDYQQITKWCRKN